MVRFNKKPYVFFTARVHPGEVPSSHIMNGLIQFLTSDDEVAENLRNKFTFSIIPMINPDGVYRGHYRVDTLGQNLNRFYSEPTIEKHPTVFGIKNYAKLIKEQGELYFYLDMHAHASKRGCFIFGNSLGFKSQVLTFLYSKLMNINSANFDFSYCNFSEKNMYSKDSVDDETKEGSARVSLYKALGITHCYTLECNYNSTRFVNILR